MVREPAAITECANGLVDRPGVSGAGGVRIGTPEGDEAESGMTRPGPVHTEDAAGRDEFPDVAVQGRAKLRPGGVVAQVRAVVKLPEQFEIRRPAIGVAAEVTFQNPPEPTGPLADRLAAREPGAVRGVDHREPGTALGAFDLRDRLLPAG